MMRVLVFEGPKAAKRFQLLWSALAAGGDGKGDRTPLVIRKEARLWDALDGVSEPAVSANGNDPDRQLRADVRDLSLQLAQDDFDLLQQYTEKTPWSPRVAREVVDFWDWLSSAEKRE